MSTSHRNCFYFWNCGVRRAGHKTFKRTSKLFNLRLRNWTLFSEWV